MNAEAEHEDSWAPVFRKQAELMRKFHEIEAQNGSLQTELVPVDLDSREGQARIKDFAWRVTEELTESWAVKMQGDLDHAREECADALHFLIELLLLAGMDPGKLDPPSQLVRQYPGMDYSPWSVVLRLGYACNELKNRPWKSTLRGTDRGVFESEACLALHALCRYAYALGLSWSGLLAEYDGKNAVNHGRIQEGA